LTFWSFEGGIEAQIFPLVLADDHPELVLGVAEHRGEIEPVLVVNPVTIVSLQNSAQLLLIYRGRVISRFELVGNRPQVYLQLTALRIRYFLVSQNTAYNFTRLRKLT